MAMGSRPQGPLEWDMVRCNGCNGCPPLSKPALHDYDTLTLQHTIYYSQLFPVTRIVNSRHVLGY